jgi:IS30 family transposase
MRSIDLEEYENAYGRFSAVASNRMMRKHTQPEISALNWKRVADAREAGVSVRDIAKRFGVCDDVIGKGLKRYGLAEKKRSNA